MPKKTNRSRLPFRKNCEGYFYDKNLNILAKLMNGIFVFPGGGVYDGENVEHAIIRETFEETGAVIKNLRKIGELKFIWGQNWFKTEKQQERYRQYQGEDMHFFIGEIIEFNESEKMGEDYWMGKKLIPIEKAIEIIEAGKPFNKNIEEYREIQLKFLRAIQNEKFKV
ncbi:MAG: NUDIX domain-containing protein [Nanoarchaeota archaeon]